MNAERDIPLATYMFEAGENKKLEMILDYLCQEYSCSKGKIMKKIIRIKMIDLKDYQKGCLTSVLY